MTAPRRSWKSKPAWKVTVVAFAVAALAVGGGAPAYASQTPSDDGSGGPIDRVIDHSDQAMPTSQSAARMANGDQPVTIVGEIPLPEDLQLRVGETVQVNYSDGVVTHEAVTAACTVSALSGNPYRTSAAQARSHHEYSLSSSCGDASHTAEGLMSSYAWPVWHQRAWVYVTVNRGTLKSWDVTKKCDSNASSLWRSTTSRGANVVASSGEVSLGCTTQG